MKDDFIKQLSQSRIGRINLPENYNGGYIPRMPEFEELSYRSDYLESQLRTTQSQLLREIEQRKQLQEVVESLVANLYGEVDKNQ